MIVQFEPQVNDELKMNDLFLHCWVSFLLWHNDSCFTLSFRAKRICQQLVYRTVHSVVLQDTTCTGQFVAQLPAVHLLL